MKKWEKVGMCGVDSGLIMLGDPCYTLHKKGDTSYFKDAFGESWSDVCDKLERQDKEAENGSTEIYEFGPEIAVMVHTLHGDGCYPVYVKRASNGRIEQAMIDFR